MFIYVVKRGDTLYEIAKRVGVDYKKIASDNQIDPNKTLVVGQALVIMKDNFVYKVKSGDSLYSISQQFYISIEDLLASNNLDENEPIYIGQELKIEYVNKDKVDMEINGYVYPGAKLDELRKVLPNLTYLSIFSYQVKPDGTLNEIDDKLLINEAYKYKVAPMMVISNISTPGEFSSELINRILSSDDLTNKLLRNILTVLREKNYYGVDFDFEYLLPTDKEAYNNFLEKASKFFSKEGYVVSTAVAPKLNKTQKGILYEAHDYNAHGKYVDHVIIMTYEWGYIWSEAMSVAPINMVEAVINYAITEIPSKKILMGMPNYGYDFNVPKIEGKPAKIITNNEAINIAREEKASILFNEVAMTPYFRYYDKNNEHEVHFDDARSIEEKVLLAIDHNLGGLSYWTVMDYFKPNWLVVNNYIDVVKLIK